MIQNELWCREAVRPIRLDPKEVKDTALLLWREMFDIFASDYPRPDAVLPINKLLWPTHWGPKIRVKNVRGQTLSIPVVIHLTPAAVVVGEGDELSLHPDISLAGYVSLTQPLVLAIQVGLGGVPVSIAKEALKADEPGLIARFESIISHELTHAKDTLGKPAYDLERGSDMAAYVNDPYEVRAFMQQVAREVAEIVPEHEEYASSPSQWVMKLVGESKTWQNISEHLRPENRRKILQGVIAYLRDLGYTA